jgi:hypothetical protein
MLNYEDEYCETRKHQNKKSISVYPCEYDNCTKQFQATEFLIKHCKAKHQQQFIESLQLFQLQDDLKRMQQYLADETRSKQAI